MEHSWEGTQHVGMRRNRLQESGKQEWKGPCQVYCFCGSETYVEFNKGGLVAMIRGAISMREARGTGRVALVPRCGRAVQCWGEKNSSICSRNQGFTISLKAGKIRRLPSCQRHSSSHSKYSELGGISKGLCR